MLCVRMCSEVLLLDRVREGRYVVVLIRFDRNFIFFQVSLDQSVDRLFFFS